MDDGPWFCAIAGEEIGPLDGHGLRELVQTGALGADDQVRHGHDGPWRLAKDVPGLLGGFVKADDDVILGETTWASSDHWQERAAGTRIEFPGKPGSPKGAPMPAVAQPNARAGAVDAPVVLYAAAPEGPPAWLKPVLMVAMVLIGLIIVGVAGLMIYLNQGR
ncbi:MAG: DUF4339 domain-containing protein [Planctomycetes bacterium]|nr:DUF4339 domain-containing protein [Planctomycetota bacterium]